MKSRRAISPVIATVILIAVAVALGIAVAVWAGALTSNLQKSEKLVIYAYTTGSAGTEKLVITVTNNSPSTSTITGILFNSAPVAIASPTYGGNFTTTASSATLASSASGTITISQTSGMIAQTTVAPGISYPITIETAAGNSYPSTVVWQ